MKPAPVTSRNHDGNAQRAFICVLSARNGGGGNLYRLQGEKPAKRVLCVFFGKLNKKPYLCRKIYNYEKLLQIQKPRG